MATSINATVINQALKTLAVNKAVVFSIINNTESLDNASNIINSMVSGFYLEDIKNMLAEIKQGLELVNSKFPVMIVESVRYCGDMEILESKEIDLINDKVTINSHNSTTVEEMTEKDFDTYMEWLNGLKKVFK